MILKSLERHHYNGMLYHLIGRGSGDLWRVAEKRIGKGRFVTFYKNIVSGFNGSLPDLDFYLSSYDFEKFNYAGRCEETKKIHEDSINKPAPQKSGFYVMNTLGAMPKVIHETYDDAKKEAIRLAEKRDGHKFIVLEIKATIEVPDSPITISEY